MARISGIEVPDQKRVEAGLVYIKGIGPNLSKKVLGKAKVDLNTRVRDLTEQNIADINSAISSMKIPVEGELRRIVAQNIRRLQDIKSYRGMRH
ncbi:MAG: 30S ribosomal protein S13, partial [Patescibacteria group bacterium]